MGGQTLTQHWSTLHELTLAFPQFLSLSFLILCASSISGVRFLLQCSFHSCSTIAWEKLSKELKKEGKGHYVTEFCCGARPWCQLY